MHTKTEIIVILKDMAQELNIVRAGSLAKIRVTTQASELLQNYPTFIKNGNQVLDHLLDFVLHEQACIETLSSNIEGLKNELDQLLETNEDFDMIPIIQKIYSIMGAT